MFNYYFFLGLSHLADLHLGQIRGFHGSVESANAIMKGYEIFYNFIRRHQSIKRCPYELAIPELKLNSENKWMELIKMANG